jgi:homoserine kinase
LHVNSVKVSIPATSANLGPGFDSLGMALGLRSTVEIQTTPGSLHVEMRGSGAAALPRDTHNLVVQSVLAVYKRVMQKPPGLHMLLTNEIPTGSGLGSSAAAIIGGVVAANVLLGSPLSDDELLDMATEIEGHPDNVSPALLGGLVVCSYGPCGMLRQRVPVAPMKVVITLPDVAVSTKEQRAALPTMVPLSDAASNIGRAVLVVHALQTGKFTLLREAMCDRLHQPHRKQAIPAYDEAFYAALSQGAAAVAISGAGPSMIAFAPDRHDRIAEAMVEAFRRVAKCKAQSWVLPVDMDGARIEDVSS